MKKLNGNFVKPLGLEPWPVDPSDSFSPAPYQWATEADISNNYLIAKITKNAVFPEAW